MCADAFHVLALTDGNGDSLGLLFKEPTRDKIPLGSRCGEERSLAFPGAALFTWFVMLVGGPSRYLVANENRPEDEREQ